MDTQAWFHVINFLIIIIFVGLIVYLIFFGGRPSQKEKEKDHLLDEFRTGKDK